MLVLLETWPSRYKTPTTRGRLFLRGGRRTADAIMVRTTLRRMQRAARHTKSVFETTSFPFAVLCGVREDAGWDGDWKHRTTELYNSNQHACMLPSCGVRHGIPHPCSLAGRSTRRTTRMHVSSTTKSVSRNIRGARHRHLALNTMHSLGIPSQLDRLFESNDSCGMFVVVPVRFSN